MGETMHERTVLPPDQVDDLGRVAHALRREPAHHARLMGPDGEVITLPDELYVVLRHAADALLDGFAVTIAPQHRMMTTQEAADLLGISRPTVVRLMESGEIPYLRRGRHRRVMLADLLDYRERTRHGRREALERMVADGEDAGVYDLPTTSKPTR